MANISSSLDGANSKGNIAEEFHFLPKLVVFDLGKWFEIYAIVTIKIFLNFFNYVSYYNSWSRLALNLFSIDI